ncbi:MAG: hypothetical protein ACTSVB_05535 [Candidatus Heimdallarchaeaceae archaeon]
MTETSLSAEELVKKYKIPLHELDFILNFMKKRNITPQLAMRRIQLYEKLEEKLKQTQPSEKVDELTKELDQLTKLLEDLKAEKEALDKEIEEKRLQEELFQAEREELKLQMNALMESMQDMGMTEEEEQEIIKEKQKLKRKINVMIAGVETLKEKMKEISNKIPKIQPICKDINQFLNTIVEGQEIPKETKFEIPEALIVDELPEIETKEKIITTKEEKSEVTISPDQISFGFKSASTSSIPKVKSTIQKTESEIEEKPKTKVEVKETEKPSRPIIKEKLFADEEEIEKAIEEKPEQKPEPKLEQKPEQKIKEKVDISSKPVSKEEKQVPPKIEKILKLFINYVDEADSNENFKARISAICDMDEAYIELGGLAMSQIYSYQTQGIHKKKEFKRLLTTWINNGLPR